MREAMQRIRDKEEKIKDKYSERNDFFLSLLDDSEDINPIDEGLAFPIVEESKPAPTSKPIDPHAALLLALGL